MDYKKYLEDFVQKIDKELEQKELYERKVDQLNSQHRELMMKLDNLICKMDNNNETTFFIDNNQFIKLMNISKRTAQQWRDTKTIAYSQIGGKIFYRISDIDQLLNDNYINAKRRLKDE